MGSKTMASPKHFGASAQKVLFHGLVLWEFFESKRKGGVFSNAIPNSVVEITHASTNALVRARVWRGHKELLGAGVLEKASLFRHYKIFRARIRHVVHNKRRWGPLRQQVGAARAAPPAPLNTQVKGLTPTVPGRP